MTNADVGATGVVSVGSSSTALEELVVSNAFTLDFALAVVREADVAWNGLGLLIPRPAAEAAVRAPLAETPGFDVVDGEADRGDARPKATAAPQRAALLGTEELWGEREDWWEVVRESVGWRVMEDGIQRQELATRS